MLVLAFVVDDCWVVVGILLDFGSFLYLPGTSMVMTHLPGSFSAAESLSQVFLCGGHLLILPAQINTIRDKLESYRRKTVSKTRPGAVISVK